MINTIFYPFISVCAESIPYNVEVRSAILSPHRAEKVRIIIDNNYNLSNQSRNIYLPPSELFAFIICSALYTWIPLFVQCFIFNLIQKVFNQKSQGYNLRKFYNKNKIIIIYNYVKENVWYCKLFFVSYVNDI